VGDVAPVEQINIKNHKIGKTHRGGGRKNGKKIKEHQIRGQIKRLVSEASKKEKNRGGNQNGG